MFWKEKRIEKRLERDIARKHKELAETMDTHQRASILLEVASLKEKSGDSLAAFEALLARAKSIPERNTVEDLTQYLGRTENIDLEELSESLLEVSCSVDLAESLSLIDSVASRDRKTAIKLAAECFRILGNTEFACTAMGLIERDVLESSMEIRRSQMEVYRSLAKKCVSHEIDGCHQCLERAIEFARTVLKDPELELEFAIDYVKKLQVSEVRSNLVKYIIDRCEDFSRVFSGRAGELLDRLNLLLESDIERETLLPLVEFMRKLAAEVTDPRADSYTEQLLEGADLDLLKREATELERHAKINQTDDKLWRRLALLFRRIIDSSAEKDQKILYIRKLGALMRDRLDDYVNALSTFEEGIAIDKDDVTLWLVKGMTLEKMAQNEQDFEKTRGLWKIAYDHYLQIAERFEEQEVKLSAIEKCAIIKAEKMMGVK